MLLIYPFTCFLFFNKIFPMTSQLHASLHQDALFLTFKSVSSNYSSRISFKMCALVHCFEQFCSKYYIMNLLVLNNAGNLRLTCAKLMKVPRSTCKMWVLIISVQCSITMEQTFILNKNCILKKTARNLHVWDCI